MFVGLSGFKLCFLSPVLHLFAHTILAVTYVEQTLGLSTAIQTCDKPQSCTADMDMTAFVPFLVDVLNLYKCGAILKASPFIIAVLNGVGGSGLHNPIMVGT